MDWTISNLQDDWHNQRPPLRLLRDVALQISANFLFDYAVVRLFFVAGLLKRLHDDLPCALKQAVVAGIKTAGHNLRSGFHASGVFVDSDDRQHETIFAEMPPPLDHQAFNDICPRTRVDTDAANVDSSCLTRSQFVELQNVPALDQHHVSN